MNVLFLCTGNSCRSQMTEGLVRQLHQEIFPWSAGVEVANLNEHAVAVMREVGVDISRQFPKHIEELPPLYFDYVITLCDDASSRCPLFPGAGKIIHRPFPDPPRLTSCLDRPADLLNVYRDVRDQIGDFVRGMPQNLLLL